MNFVPPSIYDVNLSQQPSALKIENSAIKKIKTQIERLYLKILHFFAECRTLCLIWNCGVCKNKQTAYHFVPGLCVLPLGYGKQR